MKRSKQNSPLYAALKNFIGNDPRGVQIASVLYDEGIRTPEALRDVSREDLDAMQQLGGRGRARLILLQAKLKETTREAECET
jgi:hypothetical protein